MDAPTGTAAVNSSSCPAWIVPPGIWSALMTALNANAAIAIGGASGVPSEVAGALVSPTASVYRASEFASRVMRSADISCPIVSAE